MGTQRRYAQKLQKHAVDYTLQVGFRCLESWEKHFSDIVRSFVQIEAHSICAEVLADDVELYTVLVDHIRDTPALVDDLRPAIAVEVLTAQLTAADVPG